MKGEIYLDMENRRVRVELHIASIEDAAVAIDVIKDAARVIWPGRVFLGEPGFDDAESEPGEPTEAPPARPSAPPAPISEPAGGDKPPEGEKAAGRPRNGPSAPSGEPTGFDARVLGTLR